MAVVLDVAGTQASASAAIVVNNTSLTIGSGPLRALVAQVISLVALGSVTVNWDATGTPQLMTLIKSQAGVNGQVSALYGLLNPTPGNKTLRLAWTGSSEACLNAVAWTGVDQSSFATAFPRSVSATGNNANATVGVTSGVGNAVMSAVVAGSLQAISAVSATQTMLFHGLGTIEGGGSRAAGAALVTVTGTYAGTDQWAIVGTDIQAASATSQIVAARRPAPFKPSSSTLRGF
jgi:hypothetical protein